MSNPQRIRIVQDTTAVGPRETWDNFGTMVCWHTRYTLGDVHDGRTPEEWREDRGNEIVILPLYLYDHSGLSISTSGRYPYNDKWDAGQVGWIYATHEQVQSEYGGLSNEFLEAAEALLRNEVMVYDYWLTGEVYGYVIEEKIQCDACKHTEWKHIDSCWGFYSPIKESGLLEAIPEKFREEALEVA